MKGGRRIQLSRPKLKSFDSVDQYNSKWVLSAPRLSQKDCYLVKFGIIRFDGS